MEEIWKPIKEFPNYSVSSEGTVRNEDRGRIVRTSVTQQGALKVGLVVGGKQFTRSVKKLVAETFVEGKTDLYNVPIHLDANQLNCSADNLVWRPHWFAWKYKVQMQYIDDYQDVGPIMVRKTGVVHVDIVEAAMTYGVLFYEIQMSLVNKIHVFPTWQVYDWVKGDRIV